MTTGSAVKKTGNRFTRFFTGIWSELKKVVWLSRREAMYLTMLVLIVSIAAAIVLGAFDYGFSTLVDKLLIGR
ncbi:MAG: preprotein translocase subunit SecE [Dehalococcoidales bacterium]|jgi:preprotein translocase SecE subunit|nr:preprotein translocase subunit SecE [Dehalococcoidales bacterium]